MAYNEKPVPVCKVASVNWTLRDFRNTLMVSLLTKSWRKCTLLEIRFKYGGFVQFWDAVNTILWFCEEKSYTIPSVKLVPYYFTDSPCCVVHARGAGYFEFHVVKFDDFSGAIATRSLWCRNSKLLGVVDDTTTTHTTASTVAPPRTVAVGHPQNRFRPPSSSSVE